ncbi:hypothetical protein RF11_11711 [Thelohanellus kitauei]|uniref:Uncharacterized protein n=1 Tax=Thelohanellus kitauei TaxID=669202 RepID=A0A0C2J4M2_THEKT|nr:hypothetical protein RF11_11711 [Thelohanellus kitauei]
MADSRGVGISGCSSTVLHILLKKERASSRDGFDTGFRVFRQFNPDTALGPKEFIEPYDCPAMGRGRTKDREAGTKTLSVVHNQQLARTSTCDISSQDDRRKLVPHSRVGFFSLKIVSHRLISLYALLVPTKYGNIKHQLLVFMESLDINRSSGTIPAGLYV